MRPTFWWRSVFLLATTCDDWEKKTGTLHIKKTVADIMVQGKCSGTINASDHDVKSGRQVIPDGSGRFRSVGYQDDLRGGGWNSANQTEIQGSGKFTEAVCKLETRDGKRHKEIQGTLDHSPA